MLMTLSIDRVLAVAFPVLYEIKIFIFFLILLNTKLVPKLHKGEQISIQYTIIWSIITISIYRRGEGQMLEATLRG